MSMLGKPIPNPIPLYRIVHVDTLPTLLTRGALHAPNSTPQDGLPYRTIHSVSVQASRHRNQIGCGSRGTSHDYVPLCSVLFRSSVRHALESQDGSRGRISRRAGAADLPHH